MKAISKILLCSLCLLFAALDSQRTARSATALWSFNTPKPVLASPTVAQDGTLYLASYDRNVYALTPGGSVKWTTNLPLPVYIYSGTYTAVYGTPAVGSDGTLYVPSENGKLLALNPANGAVEWEYSTVQPHGLYSSPALGSDGTIYFGSYDGNLYAINPNGSQKWSSRFDATIFTSPAVGRDGTIYCGCDDGKLYALNPNDGSKKWTFNSGPYTITASPAIATDNTLYFGVGSTNNPKFYSVNTNGTTNWTFTTGSRVRSSAAVGPDGTIYFGCDDKKLYALNPDGTKKWDFACGGPVGSSPALAADGTIYFGCDDGKFYALDAAGNLLWSFQTGNFVFASPAIGPDGTIYFASRDGRLYVVGGGQPPAASGWPMFRHDLQRTGRAPVLSGNHSPSSDLTSPTNGAVFTAPADISLLASANDTDGTISKVEFFEGATKLGEDTTSPYSLDWNSVAAGSYTLTVRVTDDRGAMTTSATVTISVVNNAALTVTITSPTNGTVLTVPATFTLQATASGSDGVGDVEFFVGNNSVGIDLDSPYSASVSDLGAGSHTLSAVATHILGAKATNSVSILVNDPAAVSLTSPTNGAVFTAPADISLLASANDTDGTISKVEFFEGATKLGEDTTSPYSLDWNSVAAGSYTLTVRVTDDRGAMTTSAAVTISVVNNAALTVTITSPTNGTVLTAPATFTLQATASGSDGVGEVEFFVGSNSVGIDLDSPYSASVSSLGVGSHTLSAVATHILGAKATNSVSILVNDPPTASLTGPTNGAVFTEPADISLLASANDTDGTISKVEFFEGATKLGEDTISPYSISWNSMAAGSYTLTVRVTDDRGAMTTSAAVTISVASNTAPTVTINSPTNGTVLTAPATFTLQATASGSDGVGDVEFFVGSNSVGIDLDSPYSASVGDLGAGSHTLSAVATDTLGAKATNSVSILVNDPPIASLTSPTNGAVFTAPADISLLASANDTDGTISKVEFFEGATKLGEDTTSPYSLDWNSVAAGSYTLTVRVTDDLGAMTTSAAVTISVVSNTAPTVTITSPTNGTVLTAPATFTFQATASGSDGVGDVEFFVGNNSVGIDLDSPYSASVSDLGAGSHTLSAVATHILGAKATNSVNILVNDPPQAVTALNPMWTGSDFLFSFASQLGRSYEAQYTDALGSGHWQLLATLTGDGSTMTVTNRNVLATQRFYRVESK